MTDERQSDRHDRREAEADQERGSQRDWGTEPCRSFHEQSKEPGDNKGNQGLVRGQAHESRTDGIERARVSLKLVEGQGRQDDPQDADSRECRFRAGSDERSSNALFKLDSRSKAKEPDRAT